MVYFTPILLQVLFNLLNKCVDCLEEKLNLFLSFLQVFVVFVTMCREAYDDFIRFKRDREVNSQQYKKLTKKGHY